MKQFLKIRKSYLLAVTVGILLFMEVYWRATLKRGYVALGGEMFVSGK